jgi:hypothetical protein
MIGIIPEAKTSDERVGIVAYSARRRQFFQFLGIASAENHIVRVEGVDKPRYAIRHIASPFLLAQPLDSAEANVILVCPLLVRKVA